MIFTRKERIILQCIEEDREHKRFDVVNKLYQRLTGSYNKGKRYDYFENLVFENSVNISLIKEINDLIDQMLLENKLESVECGDGIIGNISPSPLAQYILSKGNNNCIKKSKITRSFLEEEKKLEKKEKVYNIIFFSDLSPSIEKRSKFFTGFLGREIIFNYRSYCEKSRGTEYDGKSDIEVQYFEEYIVLIERTYSSKEGKYSKDMKVINNVIAVIDRYFYESNKDKTFSYYLSPMYDEKISIYRRDVKEWEPFDGLLLDYLHYIYQWLGIIEYKGHEKQEEIRKEVIDLILGINQKDLRKYLEKYKMIDLIHITALRNAGPMYREKIWDSLQTSNKKITPPWWITEMQEMRDRLAKEKSEILPEDIPDDVKSGDNYGNDLHNIDPSNPLSWPEDVKDALLGDD